MGDYFLITDESQTSFWMVLLTFPLISFAGISPSSISTSEKEELVEPPKQENVSLTPTENKHKEKENEISLLPSSDPSQPGISPACSK